MGNLGEQSQPSAMYFAPTHSELENDLPNRFRCEKAPDFFNLWVT